MWILLGLVSLVLVVACANIANLLLARAVEREKEVALRVALGCGRGRLMRQFLTESLLVAGLGGLLSGAVALGLGALMATLLPEGLQATALTADLDWRTLAATAGISLSTALLFGLYPAWRASRVDAGPALKEGSGSGGTVSRFRWIPAKSLVLMQVALGVLLVMAAIVYTGNLSEIVNRDAGFERAHLMVFDLRPGELGYEGDRLEVFHRNLMDRLLAVPGVASAAVSRTRPMMGGGYHDTLRTPGGSSGVSAGVHHASDGFLAALGVPVVAGRGFTAEDIRAARRVAVVSERLARELRLSNPVGATILGDDVSYEVIGVARDARYSRLTQDLPVLYLPIAKENMRSVTVTLRSHVPPLALLGAVREAVRSVDRNLPLVDLFTMNDQISRTLQRERLFAWLCGSFGVLALVLCVVGLYGLMSHATARRTPEIGIRMALGASSGEVLRQVVSEGLRLAAAGMALGIPLAIAAANFAQKQRLLDEGPIPYWTLAAAVGVLLFAALAAVCGPALRAASVDPLRALRQG